MKCLQTLLLSLCAALSLHAQSSVDITAATPVRPAAAEDENVKAALELATRFSQIRGGKPGAVIAADGPAIRGSIRSEAPTARRAVTVPENIMATTPVASDDSAPISRPAASVEEEPAITVFAAQPEESAAAKVIDEPVETATQPAAAENAPASALAAAAAPADEPQNAAPEKEEPSPAAPAAPVDVISNEDLKEANPPPPAPAEPLELADVPLPKNGASDALLPSVADELPDPSNLPQGEGYTDSPAPAPETEVALSDLAPQPAPGDTADPAARGPMFRVTGPEAVQYCQGLGYSFTPSGGLGARDGNHTVASQYPHMFTSEVHGARMVQVKPPMGWAIAETNNIFFMFCDSRYNAVRLNEGWKIRGIQLRGLNWRWVVCPKSGASTASFSVRLHAPKMATGNAVVELSGLSLEGPPGATDWRAAFPSLNGRRPAAEPARANASARPAPAPRVVNVQPQTAGTP